MLTTTPFDDLCNLLEQLPPTDTESRDAVGRKLNPLVNEQENGFSSILQWLAAWQGSENVRLNESHICIFTSSNDNADNTEHARTFAERAGIGKTVLNQLCKDRGLGLRVLEMAPELPHKLSEDWSERDCMGACAFGMEATASGGDLLALSAIAPGSDAVCSDLVFKINELKQKIIDKTSSNSLSKELLNLMRESVGRDVAALVGAIVAARSRRLPVLIEGLPAIAACYLLWAINPDIIQHVRVATVSDAAQASAVEAMGMAPLIVLANDLEPGCGLALAVSAMAPLTAVLEI